LLNQAVLLEPMGVAHNGVESIDVKNQVIVLKELNGPHGIEGIEWTSY